MQVMLIAPALKPAAVSHGVLHEVWPMQAVFQGCAPGGFDGRAPVQPEAAAAAAVHMHLK